MKFGVFSVSAPDYEPLELLDVLAELGYDGVEWRVTEDEGDRSKPTFWSGNRTTMNARQLMDNADKLKAKADALGLAMPAVGAYIDCRDLEQVELHLQATAAIGAKNVRVSAGQYDPAGNYWDQQAWAKEQYKAVAELAAKYEVRAVIETHMGQLGPSTFKARAILEGLDPKHVGIMWDPGNMTVEGNELPIMALDIMGDYLAEVHVKNMCWTQGADADGAVQWQSQVAEVHEGQAYWPDIFEALRSVDYQGWMFFEDFSTEKPLLERLKFNLEYCRQLKENA